MTGIIVLWRQSEAARCYEVLYRALEHSPVPLLATIYHHVDVYGEAVIVCTFSSRSGTWTASEELQVQHRLFRLGAETAAVIELHVNTRSSTPNEPFLDHRSKGIVE